MAETVEEIVYTAGEGHQKAINVLLELGGPEKIVEVLLAAGLQDRWRERAPLDALANN